MIVDPDAQVGPVGYFFEDFPSLFVISSQFLNTHTTIKQFLRGYFSYQIFSWLPGSVQPYSNIWWASFDVADGLKAAKIPMKFKNPLLSLPLQTLTDINLFIFIQRKWRTYVLIDLFIQSKKQMPIEFHTYLTSHNIGHKNIQSMRNLLSSY